MKRLIFVVIVTIALASSSLIACGGGSCLDQFPCNAGDDDDSADGSNDSTTPVTLDGGADVETLDAAVTDAIDDISTIDDATTNDAESDGGDAADD